MRSDAAVVLVAAGCWAAFGYKWLHLRRRATVSGAPALRALVVMLGLLAGTFTLTPQFVAATFDTRLGITGITRLVANILSMLTCCAIMSWLLHLTHPYPLARVRTLAHTRILAMALALVLVLFTVDHPRVPPAWEFSGTYTYLYLLYVAYAVASMVGLSWRYASMSESPSLRLGLRMVAAANLLGLMFMAIELVYLVDRDLNLHLPGSPIIARPVYTTAAVVFIIGVTVPAWGPRLGMEDLWWRITERRAARHVLPLWTKVTRACPGVVLDRRMLAASPYRDRLIAQRLLVEIHDAWLHLRYYLTSDDIILIDQLSQHAGHSPRGRALLVAAARLALAMHRKEASGTPPGGEPAAVLLAPVTHHTLVAEAHFLRHVANKLDSRFVNQVLFYLPTATASDAA